MITHIRGVFRCPMNHKNSSQFDTRVFNHGREASAQFNRLNEIPRDLHGTRVRLARFNVRPCSPLSARGGKAAAEGKRRAPVITHCLYKFATISRIFRKNATIKDGNGQREGQGREKREKYWNKEKERAAWYQRDNSAGKMLVKRERKTGKGNARKSRFAKVNYWYERIPKRFCGR